MKKAWSPEGEGSFRNHEAWIRLFYTGVGALRALPGLACAEP